MPVAIAPSILSADFAHLGREVQDTDHAGAHRMHVDVMDGHFVPNLSMGPAIVQSLRPVTKLPLEIHLMVDNPAAFVEPFAKAGADSLIVHEEVLSEPSLLARIRDRGLKVGLAINPGTDTAKLERYLSRIDLALCMTVHPGFSGQPFVPESPARIRAIREMIERENPSCELEVDGGIDLETGRLAVDAGANVLVAATAIFRHPSGPAAAVRAFRSAFP